MSTTYETRSPVDAAGGSLNGALSTGAATRGRLLADTLNVMTRELKPVLREPVSVLFAMVQPLVFLGLFAPLLPDSDGGALQWFVPGIVAMTCLFGASFTGAALGDELVTGSHERLLVSPLSRTSLLLGRALKEIVPMLLQAAIILAVVTPFSFDLHPLGVLVGVAVLSLFSIGVASLSFALALVSAGNEWLFWTVQQTLIFPLLLLAGILLPLDGAPGWLAFLSDVNPLRYVVAAERELFSGTWHAEIIVQGFAGGLVVAALGLWTGIRVMKRS
jgi:ABC-2 type transport system permease protein